MAAAALFAKIANIRCESSLILPMIHSECAEKEVLFAIVAIAFANFANWVMAIDLSPAA
jgi:hypothetical protein